MADKVRNLIESTRKLTLVTGVSDFLRSEIFSSSCFKRFFVWKKEKRFLFLKTSGGNKRHRADWWMGNRFNAHFLKRYTERQAFNLDKPYIWEATRGLFFFSCWVGGCFMMRWFVVLVLRCGAKTVALPSATGKVREPAPRMTNDWIYPWIWNHPSRNWERLKCKYYMDLRCVAFRVFRCLVICAQASLRFCR